MDASRKETVFISRAGSDNAIARTIAKILIDAGYDVIIQDHDFVHRHIISSMHHALIDADRVVALVSPAYLKSDYCESEWSAALYGDILNKNRRLILLLIEYCDPGGVLGPIWYTDIAAVRDDPPRLTRAVLDALAEASTSVTHGQVPVPLHSGPLVDPETVLPPADFTGRERELAQIDQFFRGGSDAVAIHGLPGTGKSLVARAYASAHRDRYAAVGWLAARTESAFIDGLVQLGLHGETKPTRVLERRAYAEKVLSTDLSRDGKPILLVLDDLVDEQLLRIWRPRAGAHLLITSRDSAWPHDIRRVPLGAWPRADSLRFLRLHAARDDLTESDAAALATALGDLPLALSHAAAYLRHTRTVTVASYLARIREHLNDATDDAEYPRSVFATFQAAIAEAELRTPGSAALACLSAFFAADGIPETLFHVARETDAVLERHLVPTDTARDLATALHTTGNVEDALGALDRFSLITFYVRTRTFDMHPLVQAAARDMVRRQTGPWDGSGILTLNAAFPRPMVLARPAFETWDICARILPHARSALALLPPDSVFHEAGSLAAKCGAYLVDRAEYAEAERLLRWSIAVAEHEPDMLAAASRWSALGLALRRMKRYDEAEELYRKALPVARSPNGLKPNEVSAILANLGVLLTDVGRFDEAEALLREATSIDIAECSDDVELAVDFDELGEVLAEQGELDEAQSIAERALPLKEGKLSEDDPRIAMTMRNIGSILAKRGLYARAVRILRKALVTLEQVYDADHPDVVQTRHDLELAVKHHSAA